MGTVTYPDATVARYVGEHFIPVQLNVVEEPDVKQRFHGHWTPTIIFQDADTIEYRRSEGYLDPKRFLGEMALGRFKAALNSGQYQALPALAREALEITRGDAWREPEALYWDAVAAYRATGDGKLLSDRWDIVIERFPQSDWAKKADI
jgi:hypothetical protein